MFGAIIGDIIGSVYEFNNIKTKEFPLFREDCRFTDDTVMTLATAEALMNGGEEEDFRAAYKKWGRLYPNAGYGGRFRSWLKAEDSQPYNSWGNGSAMRVAPVGFFPNPRRFSGSAGAAAAYNLTAADIYAQAVAAVDIYAARSAMVTHNHPEGIKGARAVAHSIMFMRYRRNNIDAGEIDINTAKAQLRDFVAERFGYDLSPTLDEIRPHYRFDVSCQGSVPQAIIAFLESEDFEDAIRNAISLGGDSDTLACIAGGIAEAAYGVPRWIKDKAWSYLDQPMQDLCRRWRQAVAEK